LKQLDEIKAALSGYQKGLKELIENGARLKEVNKKRAGLSEKLTEDLHKVTLGGVKGMTQRSSDASTVLKSATFITTSGVGVAALIGLALAFFITRSIVNPIQVVIDGLNQSSAAVAAASTQVSGASQEMARGASEQASSLEETSASLEEMASMTRQNADNALQANTMAAEASSGAESGVGAMQRMSQAIQGIKKSSDDTAKILKTIDEIAFQTNLLALNAAVEAARAGDAGKGFAVVAEEVRNLAQRSAEAAKNTAALIEESQKNADNGVRVTQEVGDTLKKIAESVKKLQQLNGEVSAASTEQSKGIDQVNTAVSEMDKVTQSNAASSEESASASEELSAQATEMSDMVATLATIVSGAGASNQMAQQAATLKRPQAPMHAPSPSRKQIPDAAKAMARDMKAMMKTKVPTSVSKHAAQVIPLTSEELSDF
jgi:methyl-accepting chemotaxis protein